MIDKLGADDLLEYETRLKYVVPKYDDAVICTYDLSKFRASMVMDALRTHPAVIIGGWRRHARGRHATAPRQRAHSSR